MPITQLLRDKTIGEADVKVVSSVFDGILREMHLPCTDPIAKVIAKNVIRFAEAGERDPVRLRERATEFLRD